jgi:hypothetical protein
MSARLPGLAACATLLALIAAAPGASAACDLDALHRYPMRDVVQTKAIPLDMPDIFFPDPDSEDNAWDAPGDDERRAALARGMASFRPEEREVMMLAAISGWTKGKDPLIGFFVLSAGAYYDEVVATLDSAGLPAHAALFREGRALFGADYGTVDERYDRWSDGYGAILDPVLDADLAALSRRYRALPDLLDIAVDRIAASPALTALYEPARAATPDEAKLDWLGYQLWDCIDHYGPPDDVSARLAALPPAYRHIAVTFIFQAEMLNGSVEQFFYNSSGTLAPDVLRALSLMRLPKHAFAVWHGIHMFPEPYPRDLEERRDIMLASGEGWREALAELTYDVDDGEMQPAMIRLAREAGILPE